MAVRSRRFMLNIKLIAKIGTFVLALLYYCESLHYDIVISQCKWPSISQHDHNGISNNEALKVMVLADTHLLGKRTGHWLDKLRREWQMHRAFQSTINHHRPDVVAFLGDIFDEGKWSGIQEFKGYKKRFDDLFPVPADTKVLVAVGNHDIGFHYSVTPRLVQQFENAFATSAVQLTQIKGVTFVAVNSVAMEGDSCFLCKPAVNKIKIIKRQLDCAQGKEDACQSWKNKNLIRYSQPIILQHYPMYRESDEICSEPDEAPEQEKYLIFREKWDCLSLESTQLIFKELKPRLVLSGHTHHGCHLVHESYNGSLVEEFTVPSFSWRNKKSPTFTMLSVTPDKYEAYKCHMPRENTVLTLYFLGFILIVGYIIKIRFANQEVCYVKVPVHSD